MMSLLWEQEDPKLAELQAKEGDTEVKKMRNAVSRLAKEKGYKLSYWQTANRNARTVYTTYGVFDREEKRPVSFEACEFTKGFTGFPGKTSTTRGSEFKALIAIEEWLNSGMNPLSNPNHPHYNDYEDNKSEQRISAYNDWEERKRQAGGREENMNSSRRGGTMEEDSDVMENETPRDLNTWIPVGLFQEYEEYNDWWEIYEEFSFIADDPDAEYLNFTEEAGETKQSIMNWATKQMDFSFVPDDSPFGGHFDTRGESFMGAAASPFAIVMIPNRYTGETMSESRSRIKDLLSEASGHTVRYKEDEWEKVIYHETVVAKWNDEKIILNNGGWVTKSTVQRMNQASTDNNLGFKVRVKDKKMMVEFDGEEKEFSGESITLTR